MKTRITHILPLLLTILFCNFTLAAITNDRPSSLTILAFDVDSLVHVSKPAKLPVNKEESYINDIPFDTWHISAGLIPTPALPAEAYIDDIPFETESIAARFIQVEKSGINLEPESYVNDIPFDTHKIASEYLNHESGKYCYKTR